MEENGVNELEVDLLLYNGINVTLHGEKEEDIDIQKSTRGSSALLSSFWAH